MSEKQIKKRGANYTPEEKAMLADLVAQFKHIIEDKGTGRHFILNKKEAWRAITIKYNSNCTTGERQTDQLKALYDNMKQKSRKNVGENNRLEYMSAQTNNTGFVNVTNEDLARELKHVKKDKVQIYKTGGGSWKHMVTDSDAKILAIIQDQVEQLSNPYMIHRTGNLYGKKTKEGRNIFSPECDCQQQQCRCKPIDGACECLDVDIEISKKEMIYQQM